MILCLVMLSWLWVLLFLSSFVAPVHRVHLVGWCYFCKRTVEKTLLTDLRTQQYFLMIFQTTVCICGTHTKFIVTENDA